MLAVGDALSSLDLFGIFANAISIVVGLLAIWLSWEFYKQTNNTEKQVSTSLAKIEAQTTSLQKLSAKWMDRLTSYVTTDRPAPVDSAIPHIVAAFTQLPTALLTQLTSIQQIRNGERDESQDELVNELADAYISLYYYTAVANYWAQFYLPDKDEFSPDDPFHTLTMRIVDMSCVDFQHMARILSKSDQDRLAASRLANILDEAKNLWRHRVRSTDEYYSAEGSTK